MWIVQRVLVGTLLTILIFSASVAQAQTQAPFGPGFDLPELKPKPNIQEPVQEPVREPVQTQPVVQDSVSISGAKPLGLPRQQVRLSERQTGVDEAIRTPKSLGGEFFRMVASLAGILLLIFALASFYRRILRTRGGLSGQIGAGGRAPAGIIEVLGRYPISAGMTLVVLRFDRKILLLSHSGGGRSKRGGLMGGGMQTLCELDSPEEVASILLKVRQESGDSIASSFEQALKEVGDATDKEIEAAMYQPVPGMNVQHTKRVAPGFQSNDEGDRFELTSMNDSPAASQVLRRRLGAMRRGR